MNPVRNLVMWYIYLLLSKKTGKWYIGLTEDMQKRILKHNAGENRSTRYGIPWKLVYCEIGLNKKDAQARERYFKSGLGRKYLKNRLKFFFAQGF